MARTKTTVRASTKALVEGAEAPKKAPKKATTKKAPKKATTKKATTKKATTKKAVASSGSKGSASKGSASKKVEIKTYTRNGKQMTMYFLNGKLTSNPNAPKKPAKKPAKPRNPETLKAALGNRLIKASTLEGKQSGTGAMVWSAFEGLARDIAKAVNEKVVKANAKATAKATKKEKTASYAYFASAAKAHLKNLGMADAADELVLPAATTFVPASGIAKGVAKGKYSAKDVAGLIISGPAFEAVIAGTALKKLNGRSRKPMQYFCEQLIIRLLDGIKEGKKSVRLTREEVAETFGVKDVGPAPPKGRKGPAKSPKKKGMTKKEIVDGLFAAGVGMTKTALMKMSVEDLRELEPDKHPAKKVVAKKAGAKKVVAKKAGTKKAVAKKPAAKKVGGRKKVVAVEPAEEDPRASGKGKKPKKPVKEVEVDDDEDDESFSVGDDSDDDDDDEGSSEEF